MNSSSTDYNNFALYVGKLAPIAILIFFAILFLQSGLDKARDRQGNLDYFKAHFEKSILGRFAGPLLSILTITELVAGVLCVIAIPMVFQMNFGVYLVAMLLVVLNLLMLFFGQRVNKDYAGASSIALYFAVAMLGIMMSCLSAASIEYGPVRQDFGKSKSSSSE